MRCCYIMIDIAIDKNNRQIAIERKKMERMSGREREHEKEERDRERGK